MSVCLWKLTNRWILEMSVSLWGGAGVRVTGSQKENVSSESIKCLYQTSNRYSDNEVFTEAVDQPTSSAKQPEVHHLGRVVHLSRFPPANLAPGYLVLQQRLWKTWRHVGTGLARSWCVPETGWRSGVEHYPAAGKPNSEWKALRNNEVMEREDGRPKQGQKVNERWQCIEEEEEGRGEEIRLWFLSQASQLLDAVVMKHGSFNVNECQYCCS